MKVKTKVRFRDLKADKIREIGTVFEVTKERFKEIKEFVEEIKEDEKAKKK